MQSRKEIQRQVLDGLDRTFDKDASLVLYLRACRRLDMEASTAEAEEDNEQAYFILLRLVELIITYLPRHPQTKLPQYAQDMKSLRNLVVTSMRKLDRLKPQLDQKFEVERRRREEVASLQRKRSELLREQRKIKDEAQQSKIKAERLAKAKVYEQAQEQLSRQLEALNVDARPLLSEPSGAPSQHDYTYPDLPMASSRNKDADLETPLPAATNDTIESERAQETGEVQYQFISTSKLENGTDLRTVFVPASLRAAFLELAELNTSRNLETCGILSGTLKNNAYFVTTLIIPAQASTSDTCHTTDEESLFNYQDQNDLFTLGWIHTHPTQTCFLSSVDLHTHCSYQLMLPEAFAIVLAPSKTPDWGAFRLTDPPGMPAIRKCNLSGLFHPHEEKHVYIDVVKTDSGAGHVRELAGMTFHIEDQRR